MSILSILLLTTLISNTRQQLDGCIPVIGCVPKFDFSYLSTNHTFEDILNNPFVMTPFTPNEINPDFLLFTCDNRDEPDVYNYKYKLKDGSNRTSRFSAGRKSKFIVHGYMDHYSLWNQQMKDYILDISCNQNGYNVIIVDWHKGGVEMNYLQAAANTRVVGNMIAHFIKQLHDTSGVTTDSFHLIGHSLGAHIVGAAGEGTQTLKLGKVKRITGLDPAGPGFADEDPLTRLDITDGSLVNILHTNGFTLTLDGPRGECGLYEAIGHYDFYPNGGSTQTGCTQVSTPKSYREILTTVTADPGAAAGIFAACNHMRSTYLPPADPSIIGSTCQLIAYTCDSYKNFLNGKCADCGVNKEKCKPLELMLDFWENSTNYIVGNNKPANKLYIQTSGSTPFCLFHYQIVVIIGGNSSVKGKLQLSFTGQIITIDGTKGFIPGNKYTSLIAVQYELGTLPIVTVKWMSNRNIFKIWYFGRDIQVNQIQVNYMSHIEQSVRSNKSLTKCYNTAIPDGKSAIFRNNCVQ